MKKFAQARPMVHEDMDRFQAFLHSLDSDEEHGGIAVADCPEMSGRCKG